MRQEISAYLRAIRDHWTAYVTGSFIFAALGLIPAIRGSSPVPWVILQALILALPVAGFFAWREERRKVLAHEAGPKFAIGWDSVHLTASAHQKQMVLYVPVNVTNEGTPGAALDWRASVVLPGGEEIRFAPLLADEYQSGGVLEVRIRRADFIQERAASVLAHGETVFGHFVGVFDGEDLLPKIGPEGFSTRIECADYKGRRFRCERSQKVRAGDGPFVTTTPTLSTLHHRPPNTLPDSPGSLPGASHQSSTVDR